MSIRYRSTRGQAPALDFEGVLLAGLASDGGLYLPESLPQFTADELRAMRGLSYTELATTVIAPFVEGSIDRDTLAKLVEASYRDFRHQAVAPVVQLDHEQWLLELFHGPTLAFKDFAMQVIAKMFAKTLRKKNLNINIVTATSGDTGSAAVEAFKCVSNVNLYVLYPHKRISQIQRKQMTTSNANNVGVFAVQGTFDDCQSIVKRLFADKALVSDVNLSGVNSINWVRILVQIIYYFSAFYQLNNLSEEKLNFCVPTGNFGDAYAGYIAKKMGLPIKKIIVATNKNDILDRVFKTGVYRSNSVSKTLSPSMDIQVASNFERLLFDLLDGDAGEVSKLMHNLSDKGGFNLEKKTISLIEKEFASGAVTDEDTLATINKYYSKRDIILCPHSAIGVRVAKNFLGAGDTIVSLGTAHPAKFKETVESALNMSIPMPSVLKDIMKKQESVKVILPSKDLVAEEIRKKAI